MFLQLVESAVWIKRLTEAGIFYVQKEVPEGRLPNPHVIDANGMHSNGSLDLQKLLGHYTLSHEVARELLSMLGKKNVDTAEVECVVALDGAIELAALLSSEIMVSSRDDCYSTSLGEKSKWAKADLVSGRYVLLCGNIFTTKESISSAVKAVTDAGGTVLASAVFVINLTPIIKEVGEVDITSLIDCRMQTYPANDCPLCRRGSKALNPKDHDGWAKIIASQ